MTSWYPLRLRGDDHDLTVEVFGDLARLELIPRSGTPDEGAAVEVSARVLIAALRAAWADEHASGTVGPRRAGRLRCGGCPDGPDDAGDGDPAWDPDPDPDPEPDSDPDPWPQPPRPARSGEPWTPAEEATVRALWLAAAPDADRDVLQHEIADAIERTPGGVHMRLRQIACDPTSPGRALDRPWGMPVSDAPDDPASPRPVLTLVPPPEEDAPQKAGTPDGRAATPAGADPSGCAGSRRR